MEKFIKFMRSEKTSALLETDPVAFYLLSLVAYRARRTKCIIRDLDIGEALIGVGDFTSVNFTAGQYRESLKRLTKYELITTRTTNKGTIAKLVSDSVYDINQDTSQQANNNQKLDTDQVATKARPNSDQDDTKTPIHNNPTTSKTIPANTINNSVSGINKNDQLQANNNPTTSELQANYKRTTTQLQLTKNERMKEWKNERMEEHIQVKTNDLYVEPHIRKINERFPYAGSRDVFTPYPKIKKILERDGKDALTLPERVCVAWNEQAKLPRAPGIRTKQEAVIHHIISVYGEDALLSALKTYATVLSSQKYWYSAQHSFAEFFSISSETGDPELFLRFFQKPLEAFIKYEK